MGVQSKQTLNHPEIWLQREVQHHSLYFPASAGQPFLLPHLQVIKETLGGEGGSNVFHTFVFQS